MPSIQFRQIENLFHFVNNFHSFYGWLDKRLTPIELWKGFSRIFYFLFFKHKHFHWRFEHISLCSKAAHFLLSYSSRPYSPILQKTDPTKKKLISISQHPHIYIRTYGIWKPHSKWMWKKSTSHHHYYAGKLSISIQIERSFTWIFFFFFFWKGKLKCLVWFIAILSQNIARRILNLLMCTVCIHISTCYTLTPYLN